ncbi:hypothetical protein V5799_011024 [Amblyomma americanum]|uniref:THAP-type domain-containing protein n=1 Tax=Amblyomma americanum TaxID=6943 RepID=A0AAQ4EIJ1_AMBAM
MVYCCVPLCKSSGRASRGISFHEFPVTDIRNQWLKNISRQGKGPGKEPWVPSDRSRVCSLHFRPENYREGLKLRRLKPDAVPTVFPAFPVYLQPSPKQTQRLLKRKFPASAPSVSETPGLVKNDRQNECIPDTAAAEALSSDDGNNEAVTVQKSGSSEPAGQPPPGAPMEPSGMSLLEPIQEASPGQLLLPTFQLAPEEALRSDLLSSKPAAKGTQTRLSVSRVSELFRQVATLSRKCRRLVEKTVRLQGELSLLRHEKKKTEAVMKKTNFTVLQEKVEQNDARALFIQEQLAFLGSSKRCWQEETIRQCVLWHAKSPSCYQLLRESGVLKLPCRSTLKRYIGACTGEVVSSLIKQRLHVEAKLHSKQARCGSLIMDEMSIKQATIYHKQSDAVHGLVNLGGAEVDYNLEDELATHLLCFVFVGLSTHYRLPVGYYFSKALTGGQLEILALKVMASVEEAGFQVVRLVADNHQANCKFFSSLSGGPIKLVIIHPLDESRQLYLSFDYCHILKNIRSQFLDEKRIFRNKGKLILPDYLRLLYKVQERQGAFKMVRCLTKKHLWPSNFEKMNVSRAVDIFSPQVKYALVNFIV